MPLRRVPASSLESLVRAHLHEAVEGDGTAALMRALGAARRRGYLTRAEFEAGCRWKSPRSIHHVRANTPEEVRAATRVALRARSEERRMVALTGLRGVSVPTASALLTLIFPRRYGVIDIRVWQLLHRLGQVRTNARGAGFTLAEWCRFLEVIRGLSARLGVTARAVELTLFGVHVRDQRGRLYAQRKGAAP